MSTEMTTVFTLPPLPYAWDALEPHIDAMTMEIHHGKHHKTYLDKLNAALEGQPELQKLPIEELLRQIDRVPEKARTAVRNNGGGHANHSLFWTVMSPQGGGTPQGELSEAIDGAFGNFESFKRLFTDAAVTRFGSGWAWLALDGGRFSVTSSANQDSPHMEGRVPILGLDVWEHAYYLKYQNRRPEYIAAWWNVVDWNQVARTFAKAK